MTLMLSADDVRALALHDADVVRDQLGPMMKAATPCAACGTMVARVQVAGEFLSLLIVPVETYLFDRGVVRGGFAIHTEESCRRIARGVTITDDDRRLLVQAARIVVGHVDDAMRVDVTQPFVNKVSAAIARQRCAMCAGRGRRVAEDPSLGKAPCFDCGGTGLL